MATPDLTEEEALRLFHRLSLPEQKLREIAKAKKNRAAVAAVLADTDTDQAFSKSQGLLLLAVATKYPAEALAQRPSFIRAYLLTERISSAKQLDAAFEVLRASGSEPYDAAVLERASGVGVTVSSAEVAQAVASTLAEQRDAILASRYRTNRNTLLAKVMLKQPWADGMAVRGALDSQLDALLGPKTAEDEAPVGKKKLPRQLDAPALEVVDPEQEAALQAKPEAAAPAAESAAPANGHAEEAWRSADPYSGFPQPAENSGVHTSVPFSDRPTMHISNTRAQLDAHLRATGGAFVTRFPPEPNGYLHIGHAKAMFVDFGMAQQYGGRCYLRFDDTNPEAEKQEFIDHIQDIVSWLGWMPWKVTHSSDYFQQLYELAVELIRRGHAYVDHQTAEQVKQAREQREPSPWRERPVAESLKLFEDMRRGLVAEGAATLRMKMDPRNENFNMYDLVAYRVKFAAHPKAGSAWCIYPSYDYTHCLVDSLENISHSLCTLEFESRRASYFWLLEVLGLYKPVVWEFARLNVTHNVMSKRKLLQLVRQGLLRGWDDPRALTLAGMRRRGVTPQGLNNFCREGGITRNDAVVHLHQLDHHVRADLDATSPRCLAVLEPLRLVLANLPEDYCTSAHGRAFPGRTEEEYAMPLTRVVYIEAADFREDKPKGYYGFCPQQPIMLKYTGATVTFKGITRSAEGPIQEVQGELHALPAGSKPPKGVLSWVAQPRPGQAPPSFEARLYDTLFKSEEPAALDAAWLEDLNPKSEVVLRGCLASPPLAAAKAGDRFQLERLGYFCVDSDSTASHMVVNRTCTLRETFKL